MGEVVGLSRRHADLLEARGLDIELLERLGVESSADHGPDWIAIPYYRGEEVVGRKYRTISGEKRFSQDIGSEQILYNWNCLVDPSLAQMPLIITEGEIDCWAALQAGFPKCVSVPGGAPATEVGDRASAKYNFLQSLPIADDLTVIIASDSDDPGAALRADLQTRLGERRCKWLRYPKGCKDLADALQKHGERGVTESINRAQWVIGNVYRMSDIPPASEAVAHASGFPGLDDHYRLRLGDLCIVTGVPSAGKSTFIGDLSCRMAMLHRWPVCFASFEQEPTRDHRRSLRTWFGGGTVVGMDGDTLQRADRWIDEWFTFIVPAFEEGATLDWLMARMSAAAVRNGCRLFVIDPWNEIEHDPPPGMMMTQYIGKALREFRGFARRYDAHVIIAAHPMKMRRDSDGHFPVPTLYDISDSAMWANRADIGIVVHRKSEDETLIRIAKSRYHQEIGKPGDVSVRYVWQRASYEAFLKPPPENYQDRRGGGA